MTKVLILVVTVNFITFSCGDRKCICSRGGIKLLENLIKSCLREKKASDHAQISEHRFISTTITSELDHQATSSKCEGAVVPTEGPARPLQVRYAFSIQCVQTYILLDHQWLTIQENKKHLKCNKM